MQTLRLAAIFERIQLQLSGDISKKWAFEFIPIIIDIERFLTKGSENIKLYTGYAGYSKRFGVLHHHQLNIIDLYEALVEVIYRRIR